MKFVATGCVKVKGRVTSFHDCSTAAAAAPERSGLIIHRLTEQVHANGTLVIARYIQVHCSLVHVRRREQGFRGPERQDGSRATLCMVLKQQQHHLHHHPRNENASQHRLGLHTEGVPGVEEKVGQRCDANGRADNDEAETECPLRQPEVAVQGNLRQPQARREHEHQLEGSGQHRAAKQQEACNGRE